MLSHITVSLALAEVFMGHAFLPSVTPHSFAEPEKAVIRHLHLDLDVDFEKQQLAGSATLTLERRAGTILRLDTLGLEIREVTDGQGRSLKFGLGESVRHLGQPLSIECPPDVETVRVSYATSAGAAALQWLSAEQTADGSHPFLFTQSQAILARTWVPCQDTPAVRMTYSAKVSVPPELMAVMSASNPRERAADGIYEFRMDQPIPSYLLALAVGDLHFQAVGPRSGVYAEPSVLEKAAWELGDTERMIEAAEKLYGPYRWERYDVIFLPPSFPFGGMENPRLTFATPTILAGDRSLVSLVAHELAHSWSGNLVTNATWNDFWLNEGFTVYFEQRIMEAVYGRDYAEMLARLSLEGLRQEMTSMATRDTWLKLDLTYRNPDDGMTAIAYDKGYLFLRLIEEQVGREKWDAFLRAYFEEFAFRSMTTESFLDYLREHLLDGEAGLESRLDMRAWVYGEGLPANCPDIDSQQLRRVAEAAAAFAGGRTNPQDLVVAGWTTHHWLYFLRSLPAELGAARLAELDEAFAFSQSRNSEILHDWLLLAIAYEYEPAMPALERFLTTQGRRKFVRPLYGQLIKTPAGRERAREIYGKARSGYHAITRETIDELLEWQTAGVPQ